MTNESDALALLRKLQGRRPYSASALLPPLTELEWLLTCARDGQYVSANDLMRWANDEPEHVRTLCRVLIMVAAVGKVDAADIHELIVQLKTTRVDRRRPVKPIRQPSERDAPRMF